MIDLYFDKQGIDLPDVEVVDQIGAPINIEVWIQRAGRGGRNMLKRVKQTSIFSELRLNG